MREGGIVVAAGDGEGAEGDGEGDVEKGRRGRERGGGHDAMIDLYITFEDHLYGISSRADIQT